MQNHIQFIRIRILFNCCLANFLQLFFSSELQIHFKIIKIFSVEAEMLLWFLKDQRVYLHNVLFSLLQLGIFSRCRNSWHHVIKPMYKIEFVIFRHVFILLSLVGHTLIQVSDVCISSSWSLWRNLVHHIEHVLYAFSHRTLDDCWTEPRNIDI